MFEAIESTLKSKEANSGIKTEKRIVSEEYVKEQINKHGNRIIKDNDELDKQENLK